MPNEKQIRARVQQKHDLEDNWLLAVNFIPKQGELIVYDVDKDHPYERIKIGDGIKKVNELPFIDENFIIPSQRVVYNEILLSKILKDYILEIDYDTLLAFNTSEIIIGMSTSSILGQAILGQLILA